MKHTPGPWSANLVAGPTREVFAGDILICDTGVGIDDREQVAANTHYIVEACNAHPTLKSSNEALVKALEMVSDYQNLGAISFRKKYGTSGANDAKLVMDTVRSALALAKGV